MIMQRADATCFQRGYVALAVDGPRGTVTAEADTGHGRRDENMVEFALAALKHLRDHIVADNPEST